MNNNSIELVKLFHKVAKKGYVKSVGTSWGNIGITFEHEIGKLPDAQFLPDFNDIEIKCSSRFTRYPIYLFTIVFDGPSDKEIYRLADKYGEYDKDFSDKKVLFASVKNEINFDDEYTFVFDVCKEDKKVYLCVFDKQGELLERESYVNFESLENRLNIKLKKMAYIKASRKIIDNEYYYRYYSIFLYKIKGFDTFLDMLSNGLLNISIISRVSKSGNDIGRYRNKNIEISIRKENLPLLFDCYYQFDYDKKY